MTKRINRTHLKYMIGKEITIRLGGADALFEKR